MRLSPLIIYKKKCERLLQLAVNIEINTIRHYFSLVCY